MQCVEVEMVEIKHTNDIKLKKYECKVTNEIIHRIQEIRDIISSKDTEIIQKYLSDLQRDVNIILLHHISKFKKEIAMLRKRNERLRMEYRSYPIDTSMYNKYTM